MSPEDKKSAAAALIFIAFFGGGFLAMPKIMLWLGGFSPWLGAVFGTLFVLAFFGVFWLRKRFKDRQR
jgi:hypothetical protein